MILHVKQQNFSLGMSFGAGNFDIIPGIWIRPDIIGLIQHSW
jgi:hypothetical protein